MVYGHNTESQIKTKLLKKCFPIFNFTDYEKEFWVVIKFQKQKFLTFFWPYYFFKGYVFFLKVIIKKTLTFQVIKVLWQHV